MCIRDRPISVPRIVLAVEKAFMLLKKLVMKKTIALEDKTDNRMSPTTFKRLLKGSRLPPYATI